MPSMTFKPLPSCDPCRDAAWCWIQRQHEIGFEDEAFNAELNAWLQADPANRAAYDQAARIWLLTGFIPALEQTSEERARANESGSTPR